MQHKQASKRGTQILITAPFESLPNIKESIDFTFVKRMAMDLFERRGEEAP
jgi:hypothetical protein